MTSSFLPSVSASKKYRIIKIDSPVRIFDFTAGQLLAISGIIFFGMLMMIFIDPHWRFGGLSLRSFVFLSSLSCLPLVTITDIRPFRWWRRRVVSFFKPLEDNLPALSWHQDKDTGADLVTVDDKVIYHFKFSLSQTAALDLSRQQTITAAFFNSVESSDCAWQLFISPESDDSIYVVTADLAELNAFKKIICQHIGTARMASREEIRRLLYRHLTPSSRGGDAQLPALTPGVSDALTLAASGFEQTSDHLLVDGMYAQTVTLTGLPPFTHFGIVNDIFREDLQASIAVFFNSCDQTRVRKDLQIRYRLGSLVAQDAKLAPAIVEATETIIGLTEGRLSAVDMAVYACYYAHSAQESAEKYAKLSRAINRFNGVIRDLQIEELNGLLTVLPLGKDLVGQRHRVTASVAATFTPFICG